MKSKFVFTGQDIVDCMNDSMIVIVKAFKRQNAINRLTALSSIMSGISTLILYWYTNQLRKEIEDMKRLEGE